MIGTLGPTWSLYSRMSGCEGKRHEYVAVHAFCQFLAVAVLAAVSANNNFLGLLRDFLGIPYSRHSQEFLEGFPE